MPHKGKSGHRSKSIKKKKKKPSSAQKEALKRAVKNAVSEGKATLPKKKKSKAVKKEEKSPDDEDKQKSLADGEVDPRFIRKHGRVIIRNLPFQVTEENLRKHLENYGPIEEVNILLRPDGKLVGCGFVQFASKMKAQQAITECNAKPFLGRPIIFDWAVPKDQFKAQYKPPTNPTKVLEKDEPKDAVKIKKELEVKEIKEDEEEEDDVEKDYESDSANDSLNESDEEDEPKMKIKKGPADRKNSDRPPVQNSENEGCTVFVKNVSFQTNNEELKEFMETFGPVHYALICKDPLTEHSRGTAFVKFRTKENAEKCMSAGSEELTLDGSVLSAMPALSREDAKRKVDEDKGKNPKDARNLYLTKEGVVVAGSKAAKGVSVSDMTKRLQLDQWKAQVLKNLKMFVSRYRLVIHNLPPNYTDNQLRKLFFKHAGPDSEIKEAKVMRDLKNVESNGLGKSKEYGFVSFTKHEHALAALRNINNNPDIFKPEKRPIVAFSIENKAILTAKHKRMLKSQAMNPNFQQKHKNSLGEESQKKDGKRGKNANIASQDVSSEEVPTFGGLTSKPGPTKMRARHKLKDQLKIHVSTVKEDKKKKKALLLQPKMRTHSDSRSQHSKEKKLKRKSKMEDAAFVNLVKKYKTKLASVPQKWYENDAA